MNRNYLEKLFNIEPYCLESSKKKELLSDILNDLTSYHIDNCDEYRKIINAIGYDKTKRHTLEEFPFLPVRIFKEYNLRSISDEHVATTMTSSGTSGQQVSKIFLDKETSLNQKKALSHIISSYIGSKRLPLLIIDSKSTLKDRKLFGARGAGILGFSILGRDITYALDSDMNLDLDVIRDFLDRHRGEDKLLFGYTFIVWQHFYLKLTEEKIKLDFERNSKLFHIGGWKKLQELAVDDGVYRNSLKEQCNIGSVHNYYGMAEQLGSVYVQCEYGHMHTSNFSDIIIRNPLDWSVQPRGKEGLIELVSTLPKSYPGHVILTEDMGVVEGEDDCPCGRKGKYFKILGRVKNAEIRGCSDTYADKFERKQR